jgi:hypothetical protein
VLVDLAESYNNLYDAIQFFGGVVHGIFCRQPASLDWADWLYPPVKSFSPVSVVTADEAHPAKTIFQNHQSKQCSQP